MKKLAINGFGRIGRLFFRNNFNRGDFNIVAVNDLGDAENLAYLLKFDTVYGKYSEDVRVGTAGNKKFLIVGKKKVLFLQEKDPNKLPWKELKIDLVLESTGVFESYEKSKVHLDSGAKRVVITAPAKDSDGILGKTVLCGINIEDMKSFKITSNGSCTTNAISPVMKILSDTVGIENAILNTVHAYTATQNIVDGPVKGNDFRRGRSAAQNISPSTTGAAIALSRGIPALNGKFDGIAMRVPVPTGSVADITFVSKRKTNPDEINKILWNTSKNPQWKNILKVSYEKIVSSDIIGEPYGAIIDAEFTKVVGGNLVKILSWYDNEAGYVSTLKHHVIESLKCI